MLSLTGCLSTKFKTPSSEVRNFHSKKHQLMTRPNRKRTDIREGNLGNTAAVFYIDLSAKPL